MAGGTGFIGRRVCAGLEAAGHEVRVLGRRASADIQVDVTRPLPPAVLRGCEVVVNLVGIKRAEGANTFQAAHLEAVRNLADAATHAGISRFIHVSVVDAGRDDTDPYMRTKGAAEAELRGRPLDLTILRPSVVYGPGDDMLSKLVEGIRLAPLFPVPHPTGALRPVDVEDVADAVVRCLARPRSIGRTYDVAGPESLDLAQLARRTAGALELPTVCPPVPRPLMMPAAALMEALPWDPPVTRSQLRMLGGGLGGDPANAARELDLQPRALEAPRIREVAGHVPVRLPSLRVITDAAHGDALRSAGTPAAVLGWLLPALLLIALFLPASWGPWARAGALNLPAALLVAVVMGPMLRRWVRATWRHAVAGLLAAVGLYAAGFVVTTGLDALVPGFAGDRSSIYQWREALEGPARLVALACIVLAEDLVWRGAVALPLMGRLGPIRGAVLGSLAFGAAHLTLGPPVLWFAAVAAGLFWNLLLARSRSLTTVFLAHLAWDLAVLELWPY